MISDKDKHLIAQSLNQIGVTKTLGYLPLKTIHELLGWGIEDISSYCEQRKFAHMVLGPSTCCIASGACYVWLEPDLTDLVKRNQAVLEHYSVFNSHQFVQFIGKFWLPADHPVMPIVSEAFGDE